VVDIANAEEQNIAYRSCSEDLIDAFGYRAAERVILVVGHHVDQSPLGWMNELSLDRFKRVRLHSFKIVGAAH